MARKQQGYNARLDESLGSRNSGTKTQSLKSRRDESKGTEKSMGKRAYSAVSTMDKANGGSVRKSRSTPSSRNPELTPQHKRLAMGQKVPQGTSPVNIGAAASGKRRS
tara:strand:- start:167 stop:490 length:324 start_codon:yes stop_codon:yes gene_type:complete